MPKYLGNFYCGLFVEAIGTWTGDVICELYADHRYWYFAIEHSSAIGARKACSQTIVLKD